MYAQYWVHATHWHLWMLWKIRRSPANTYIHTYVHILLFLSRPTPTHSQSLAWSMRLVRSVTLRCTNLQCGPANEMGWQVSLAPFRSRGIKIPVFFGCVHTSYTTIVYVHNPAAEDPTLTIGSYRGSCSTAAKGGKPTGTGPECGKNHHSFPVESASL